MEGDASTADMSVQANCASLYLGFSNLWCHKKIFLPAVQQALCCKSHWQTPFLLFWFSEGREWLKIHGYQTCGTSPYRAAIWSSERQEVSLLLYMISERLFLEWYLNRERDTVQPSVLWLSKWWCLINGVRCVCGAKALGCEWECSAEDGMLERWAGGWAKTGDLEKRWWMEPLWFLPGWVEAELRFCRKGSGCSSWGWWWAVSVEVGWGEFVCVRWMRRSIARKEPNPLTCYHLLPRERLKA